MEVGLQLFTKEQDYSLPQNLLKDGKGLPMRVPTEFNKSNLSEMVNHLLKLSEEFDFIVNGQFLRCSLAEYLQQSNTSAEQLLQVEYIISVKKPSLIKKYGTEEWIKSIHFYNDILLSGSFDGVLRSHEFDSKVIATHEDSNINQICSNKNMVITGGQNGEVRFWNIELEKLLGTGVGSQSSIESVATNNEFVAAGNWEGRLLIFKIPTKFENLDMDESRGSKKRKLESIKGLQPSLVLKHQESAISAIRYTNSALFTGSWDHCIRKYDSEFNLLETTKFDSVVNSLHSNHDFLVSGHSDGTVRLLDSKTNELVQSFVKQPNQISCVQIVDNIIGSSCYDGSLRFFDIRNTNSVLYSVQVSKGKKLFDMEWKNNTIAVAGQCSDIYLINAPK
eukprot:NODE_94_length_21525_cov_0.751003.p5 type:complete len:392 gc:universal NODE_94_length_21525_cov_0.751003:9815-8640(-)